MGWVKRETLNETLTQAVIQAPMFPTRWRWVASVALAVRRMVGVVFHPTAERNIAEVDTLLNHETLARREQHLLLADKASLLGVEVRQKFVQRLFLDGLVP